MKGQNPFVSETFVIAISVLFIFFIITTMNLVKKDHLKFIVHYEENEICNLISTSIWKMYEDNFQNGTYVYATSKLDLPKRITMYPYEITMSGHDIYVNTSLESSSCKVPLNITMSGKSMGGNVTIKMRITTSGQEVTIS